MKICEYFWYLENYRLQCIYSGTRCVSWMVFLIPNRQMMNTYLKAHVSLGSVCSCVENEGILSFGIMHFNYFE